MHFATAWCQYDPGMSTPQHPFPQQQPSWQPGPGLPQHVVQRDSSARRLALVGVSVGLAGVCVGIWSLLSRPDTAQVQSNTPGSAVEAPAFTSAEIVAAKEQICEAHELTSNSVKFANNPPDPGDDLGLRKGNIALAQLSLVSGAVYMQNQIEPALAPELKEAVDLLIEKWLFAANEGIGGGSATYDQDVLEANVASEEVENLCR